MIEFLIRIKELTEKKKIKKLLFPSIENYVTFITQIIETTYFDCFLTEG